MKDIQETLERIVPEPARNANWDAVLRDARPSRARRAAPRLVILGAAVALAALVSVAPWRGAERTGILDRALAAVGDGPVVHAVLRYDPGVTRVDLKTAQREPLYGETELWYDADRGLLHEIRRFGGITQYEWVSRRKEPPPELGVLTVVSREYRHALETGTARVTGQDAIDGVRVYWITVPSGRGDGWAWQVAVSRATFEPVLIRSRFEGKIGPSEHVLRLERMSTGDADLDEAEVTSSPTIDPSTTSRNVVGSESGNVRIPLGQVAKTLGRTPLWLGREHVGLPLADYADRLYIRPPGGEVQTSGISLHYEKQVDNLKEVPGRRTISIAETTDPGNLSWPVMPGLLREGSILVLRDSIFEQLSPPMAMYGGYLVRDGVYVSIAAVGYGAKSMVDEKLVLGVARALRPMLPLAAN